MGFFSLVHKQMESYTGVISNFGRDARFFLHQIFVIKLFLQKPGHIIGIFIVMLRQWNQSNKTQPKEMSMMQ